MMDRLKPGTYIGLRSETQELITLDKESFEKSPTFTKLDAEDVAVIEDAQFNSDLLKVPNEFDRSYSVTATKSSYTFLSQPDHLFQMTCFPAIHFSRSLRSIEALLNHR